MYYTRRPSNRGSLASHRMNNKSSQILRPPFSMAGFINIRANSKSLVLDGITLTQNIVHFLGYLTLLPTKQSTITQCLLICVAPVTAAYYALVIRVLQPKNLKDGSVEPPMISSWIPWVGSAFDYFAHPLTFFKRYRCVKFHALLILRH